MWSQTTIEQYISGQIQENLNLEYKSAKALSKDDRSIAEISKDVSSMANSQGGVIIYGVKEFDEKAKRHLPEKIDPIDQTLFTKEWLEQVITSNIRPRIQGLGIFFGKVTNPFSLSGIASQITALITVVVFNLPLLNILTMQMTIKIYTAIILIMGIIIGIARVSRSKI